MNTKKLGDRGLGIAISHFTSLGYTVLIPLTDSQDYDLVVDDGKSLSKIQVKYTSYKVRDVYSIWIAVKGGTKGGVWKTADEIVFDKLFVATDSEDKWLIPRDVIGSTVTLGKKYKEFKV